MLCASPAEALRIESQLKAIVRPMYSSPPLAGARIVHEVTRAPKSMRGVGLRTAQNGPCSQEN
jgi:aspartate/tyrosine/aromatic aminotransferase|tara:strand:- start:1099 stop:1287 length:189 start_codon:yes stop_codon:yes gene_type:complete